MRIIRIVIVVVAASIAPFLCSQAKPNHDPSASVARLATVLDFRDSASDPDEKEKYEKQFEKEFISFLRTPEGWTSSFKKLPVETAGSPDGKFRIHTWNTTLGGTWIEVAGIIQWRDESNALKAISLNDSSLSMTPSIDTTQNLWIGAIYSQVYPISVDGHRCYLALGWTTWGSGTQTAVVEVFEPRGSTVVIGKPIFDLGGPLKTRLVFVYARMESMDLEYDPKTETLQFDNLEEPSSEAGYEGSPDLRKPDGTVTVLKFKKDHFEKVSTQ
jgi:hypothetical protein